MRVIAGKYKGLALKVPNPEVTRPLTDRAKEGIFNALWSRYDLSAATVCDLYAGSGSLGIEALSRGVDFVTFVESSNESLEVLRSNLTTCEVGSYEVIAGDCGTFVSKMEPCGLAFCDPPYRSNNWEMIFQNIVCDVLVTHSNRTLEIPRNWTLVGEKIYGRVRLQILEPS